MQTRRSHLTAVGHQRGKCIGSNCGRPSGFCVSRLCVLHVLCMLGWQRFVVQRLKGLFCCVSRWLERRR